MINRENLESEIKNLIVERLGLDILPAEIDTDSPIFDVDDDGKGLGLDSIDALELIVGINESYGVKHQSDDLSVLYSVKTIADYVGKKVDE